ncbi:uncharacterized protein LOC133525852 [Cydia pomonella]|uniref:uncharacterized protein LOC133525852 n=1 Tax=Cydia pomonella TaxID=82600 RepID=UPI002ADE0513|nr:uncharacterized protein LOC133525852 [Cydia pomonella]
MLRGIILASLILLCRGYINHRLQNMFNELRQSKFLPEAKSASSGGGAPRYAGPQPRPYARPGRWLPAAPNFDIAAGVESGSGEQHPQPYPHPHPQPFRHPYLHPQPRRHPYLHPHPQPRRHPYLHPHPQPRRHPYLHPHPQPRRQAEDDETSEESNFNNTYFCPMPGMAQEGATLAQESEYPWIARVVHTPPSSTVMAPLICTAAVISSRILITAAKCIATAKANYTTVLIRTIKLAVKTFVFPAEPSKQMFDDVGFIITWHNGSAINVNDFKNITLTSRIRVNDNSFNFFEEWAIKNSTIVGFIASEESPGTHKLYKLENMHASNRVCNEIYPTVRNSNDYWAPCVHSCGPEEHNMNSETCRRYLLGLGHMVVDEQTNELIGIVTWTCANSDRDRLSRQGLPMPLGLAVPNKKTSDKDRNCSINVRDDSTKRSNLTFGYYRTLCVNLY